MKETIYDEGGRPFYDDDLEIIQNEAQTAALALYAGLGRDCIVSGCAVAKTGNTNTYTIGAGFVFIAGRLLRFLGASGVALPASLVAGEVTVLDERSYETGVTKTCIEEQFATVAPGPNGVPVHPLGGLTVQHVLRGTMWELGDIKAGQLVTADYDDTGLGKPGSLAWGWALANGNHKTANLSGQFVVGLDPSRDDYSQVGKTGGLEQVSLTGPQNGPHTHAPDGGFAYNQLLRKAPLNSRTTAASTDGNGNGGSEPDITTSQSLQSSGQGEAHENRPPFYVLAMRQWIGF